MFSLGIGGPVNVNQILIEADENGSMLVIRSGQWSQATLNLLRDWAENGAVFHHV